MAELMVGATKRARPAGAGFDPVFRILCFAAATTLLTAIAGVLISLLIGGEPAFAKFGLKFFTSTVWNPVTDEYGGAGPIGGNRPGRVVARGYPRRRVTPGTRGCWRSLDKYLKAARI